MIVSDIILNLLRLIYFLIFVIRKRFCSGDFCRIRICLIVIIMMVNFLFEIFLRNLCVNVFKIIVIFFMIVN